MAGLKIGQKVTALLALKGRARKLKITGVIVGISNHFGREDYVIGEGRVEEFAVNRQNIKTRKDDIVVTEGLEVL